IREWLVPPAAAPKLDAPPIARSGFVSSALAQTGTRRSEAAIDAWVCPARGGPADGDAPPKEAPASTTASSRVFCNKTHPPRRIQRRKDDPTDRSADEGPDADATRDIGSDRRRGSKFQKNETTIQTGLRPVKG